MKRERYIDIVKGLSILCIVFLHYEKGILPTSVCMFIGSFMVTSFYVSAGWISAMKVPQHTMKELIHKRWKQLGIPYLWWTAIILLFDAILWLLGYYDNYFMAREIYKAITLRGIGTLWFLPALLGGEIIWCWLRNKNSVFLILAALAISICYRYFYDTILGNHTETLYRIVDAPFRTIYNIIGAWVGIAFGHYTYLYTNKNILKSDNYMQIVVGLVICIFSYLTTIYPPQFLSPVSWLIAPYFGPLGLLLLAKSIQSLKICDYLDYWGRNSLNLMVTHYSLVMVLFSIFIIKVFNSSMTGWISIACFILSMPIQHLLVHIVYKYARFTLGK